MMGIRSKTAFGHTCSTLLRVLLVVCVTTSLVSPCTSTIAVNFGQTADDLPSPETVVELVKSTSVKRVKIYGADPVVLTAFAGTGIEVVIGAGNDQIIPLAVTGVTPSYADQWVQTNILAYPNTSIVAVALGNEVLSYQPNLTSQLLPALKNLHAALVSQGLDSTVKLSTPHSLGIVAKSFPPSYGEFHYLLSEVIGPLLEFSADTGAPFMLNAYPYFAYAASPTNVSLDYVLFSPDATPVFDDGSGLYYTNMFDAQVDAVYAAISKLGYTNVSLTVTETGWPSAGDPTEEGATMANAQMYNYNLVQHIKSGVGTPAKPNVTVETYIFALYNEDKKPGPASERNFGLYMPDGTALYNSGLAEVSPDWYPPPVVTYPPPVVVTYPPPVVTYPPPVVVTYPPPVPALPPVYPTPPPIVPATPPVTTYSPPPPSFFSPPPPVETYPPPVPVVVTYPPPTTYSPPPPYIFPPPPVATPPTVGVSPPPVVYPPPTVATPPTASYPPPVVYPPPTVATPPTGEVPPPPYTAAPPVVPPPGIIGPPGPPGTPAAPAPGVPSWCVANPVADLGQLQIALNWACSDGGADCSQIQSGAACFDPNTLVAHCSYAFNEYYQLNHRNYWNCFFSGTAMLTSVDPSYTGCTFTQDP